MNATNSLSDWLGYIEHQHPQTISMGLERVREVAARMGLGRPARRTIVVAGTNGKGSTVAFIEAIARAAGWKVGAYTSPHLLRYNERVRVDGREVDDAELVGAFAAVERARGQTALTYFEYGTLAALSLFGTAGLDLAVLEVGLGGRLDAVNLVDADVAVITTVDIDHVDWLGADRERIGAEKAGIIRAWKPLVLGEIDPPSSVLRRGYQLGANTLRLGCDFFVEPIDAGHWCWRDVSQRLKLPMPALRAPVQLDNAATAIAALRALAAPIAVAAWSEGVIRAAVAARMQSLVRDGVEILVDVGHNPQAARALAAALCARPVSGRTRAVYAALTDKDAPGVVAALAEVIDDWCIAGLDGARGQQAAALSARLHGTAAHAAPACASVAIAVRQTLATMAAGDRLLVFGSFHTAAEALQALHTAA